MRHGLQSKLDAITPVRFACPSSERPRSSKPFNDLMNEAKSLVKDGVWKLPTGAKRK